MKKIFTLIAACVFTAMSAMAQTVYYSMDYEADGVEADWVSGITDRYAVSIKEKEGNHYLSVDAVGTGNNGTTITCNATNGKVAANTDFFMSFDLALYGANTSNQHSTYYIYDSTNSTPILKIYQNNGSDYKNWTINDSKAISFSNKGVTANYKIAIKNGAVYLTVTEGTTKKLDQELVATGVSGLGKMTFATAKYYAGMTIDNVLVRSLQEGDAPAVAKHNYTINAVAGEKVLKQLANGSTEEYADFSVAKLCKYIKDGNDYYVLSDADAQKYSKTFKMGTSDAIVAVNYTKDSNVDYYIECENMSKSHSQAASLDGNDYSNGSSPRHYTNSWWWTGALEGGKYTMTAPYKNNNTSGTVLTICYRNSNGDVIPTGITFVGTNGARTVTIENIPIPEGCSFVIQNANTYNSNVYIDYITLKKTGDVASIPVTVNDNGTASYVAPCNLDFEGTDLRAFVATAVTETAITLEEVTKVKAGQPIVVKGESCDVNVIASADAPATNLFTSGAKTVAEGENVYALGKADGLFHKVATGVEIPAGKAYIVANTNAKSLSLDFGGETTGINNVTTKKMNGNAFNLMGQKVSANAKGIVIINGKKFVK